MTAKDLIIERLKNGEWLAVHEIKLKRYSENCVATRLPEMAKQGVLESRVREGTNYKEWHLVGSEHGRVDKAAVRKTASGSRTEGSIPSAHNAQISNENNDSLYFDGYAQGELPVSDKNEDLTRLVGGW